MADAVVSIAKKKLADVAKEKLDLFTGAADELEKLKNTFQSIEALLDDAESRQVGEESVRLWLSRLKAVSYDIDDVLDEWGTISSGGLGDEEGGVSRSKGLVALTMSALLFSWMSSLSETISYLFLFSSLYVISLAQGGYNPCLQAFGAGQLENGNDDGELEGPSYDGIEECGESTKKHNEKRKSLFFQWWYFGVCTGSLSGSSPMLLINPSKP